MRGLNRRVSRGIVVSCTIAVLAATASASGNPSDPGHEAEAGPRGKEKGYDRADHIGNWEMPDGSVIHSTGRTRGAGFDPTLNPEVRETPPVLVVPRVGD